MIEKTFVEIEGQMRARVTFTLPDTVWADCITLVGDFNAWDTRSHPLRHTRAGVWTITVDLEPARAYQFRYLKCESQWINDRNADAYVHNVYGSDNFVVITDPNFHPYSDERTLNK